MKKGSLPKLASFTNESSEFLHDSEDECNFLDFAPNLQQIKTADYTKYLINNSISCLKKISIEQKVPKGLKIEKVLQQYPALENFTSKNLKWTKK